MAKVFLTRKSGVMIIVESSYAECAQFGWRHGDRFIDHEGERGEVMGVGFGIDKDATANVLWVILDKNRSVLPGISNGFATYYRSKRGGDASKNCLRRDEVGDILELIEDLSSSTTDKPQKG